MSNAQDVILSAISAKLYSNLVAAMLIMAFFILGEISIDNVTADLELIGWTYNNTTNVYSDGTTDYSVYDLINTCCTQVYPIAIELGKFTLQTVINSALSENYITTEQATTLKGSLTV
jgi:hypothetical protein